MKEVIVFSAQWCGQCQPFKKALEQQGVSFENVDADEHQKKMIQLGVRSLPTTLVMEDGVEVARITGNKPQEVKKALEG
jgi:thioredoxin 2